MRKAKKTKRFNMVMTESEYKKLKALADAWWNGNVSLAIIMAVRDANEARELQDERRS